MMKSAETRPVVGLSGVLARLNLARIETWLFGVLAVLTLVAFALFITRGTFYDEMFTLAMTAKEVSFPTFLHYLSLDVHPAGYFLLVYPAEHLGMEALPVLRFFNLIGVPLVIWSLMFAERNGVMNRQQSLVLGALCMSSFVFLSNFGEMRGYFILACASVSISAVWLVLAKATEAGEKPTPGMLGAWAVMVLIISNLHYYGAILAGVLTAALLIDLARTRSWAGLLQLGGVSLLAVAPAAILAIVQMGRQPDKFWISTTTFEAMFLMLDFVRAAVLNNLAAFALAFVALVGLVERRRFAVGDRSAIILLACVAAFFAVVLVMNMKVPMVVARYLTPAVGPLLVGATLLAIRPGTMKLAAVSVIGFGILASAQAVVLNKHDRGGWEASAELVARRVQECPSTRVFAMWDLGPGINGELAGAAYKKGYELMAAKYGLNLESVPVHGAIPVGDVCPNIYWEAHAPALAEHNAGPEWALAEGDLHSGGEKWVEYTDSGAVVYIAKERPAN
jgi:hypothetical protein